MTIAADYFEQLYARSGDPWKMRTRWYEERKRRITCAVMPRACYDAAFEPGCSIGELSAAIAPRCLSYIAWDNDGVACAAARQRLVHLPQVRVDCADFRTQWPGGSFDLIVVSEIGYYFDEGALRMIATRCRRSLRATGTLVGCHWRHPVEGCALSGDRVQDIVSDVLRLPVWVSHVENDFRLDVWCDDQGSVAREEGLL